MKRLATLLLLLLLGLAAAAVWLRPVAPPAPDLPPLAGTVDRIVVEKAARRMTLWRDGQPVREYRVALGFAPQGDKTREGDGRTPEGVFRIDRRNDRSRFHLSLGIDYPQDRHRTAAQAGGYSPGGDIMIHGQPNGMPDAVRLAGDWTAGCVAVTNAEMREIWEVAGVGTVVEIRP